MKRLLDSKDRVILQYLYKFGGHTTPHKIAEDTNLAYNTVKKHIDKLLKLDLILPVYGVARIKKKEEVPVTIKKTKESQKRFIRRSKARRFIINYSLIFKERKG